MSIELCDVNDNNGNPDPDDHDLPRIQALRQECQVEIDSINEKIGRMVEQRELVEARLKRYDSLLAPIKRVPADVLSTIFELTTDVATRCWEFPTVLPSRICKAWRNMAIELPTLWSTIRIIPPYHPCLSDHYTNRPLRVQSEMVRKWEKKMKGLQEALPLWITRSKECPLSVTLQLNVVNRGARNGWGGEDPPVSVIPFYKELVRIICSAAHRWQAVDFDILTAHPEIVSELLALQPEDVPRLITISLQTGDQHRSDDGPTFHPAGILSTTSLRSATIIYFDRPWHELSVRWGSLRELQLGARVNWAGVGQESDSKIQKALGSFAFVFLLSMCPNLERCEVAVHPGREDPWDWPATLVPHVWNE